MEQLANDKIATGSEEVNWFVIDELSYQTISSTDATHTEKWSVLDSCCSIKNMFCASKLKIVYEIFYQALIFSSETGLNFSAAALLLQLLSSELHFLANKTSEATEQFDVRNDTAALDRFLGNVRVYYRICCLFSANLSAFRK